MNVDPLRTNDAVNALLINIEHNQIDIECIQETHIGQLNVGIYQKCHNLDGGAI